MIEKYTKYADYAGKSLIKKNNRVYIAGSIKNTTRVKDVISLLEYQGCKCVYDWTRCDQEKIKSCPSYRKQVIDDQLRGINNSEIFVLITPGGRGAHVELGVALSQNKKIILLLDNLTDLNEVLMYSKDSIIKVYSVAELMNKIDEILNNEEIPF